MLKAISEKIVNWQINNGFLKEEEKKIYIYAYEIFLNQVINLLISGFVAWVFHVPAVVLVFLICYIPLRSYCGGYHASTNFRCTIISTIILVFVCIFFKNYKEYFCEWYPLVFVLSGILIIRYAPIPDINKPLDESEVDKYKKMSRIIWGLQAVIGVILYLFIPQIGMIIGISHTIFSIMLFISIVKYKHI